uniref:Heparin-binding hemagglutinin n=1 Tax=Streptomyces sp. NBC_00003 TaxID=2903608 RepID=A0AAU2V5N0_9ACTN
MAITDDLRKTLTDPTPLYFLAGTADIAGQQAKKVPALIEKIQAEAPERIEAVRRTDPKAVQEKAAARVKEVQAAVTTRANDFLGALDGDLKKLGENAQDLALRGVGVLAEYAVKAREGYDSVAEHGQDVVKQWRGEAADEIVEIATAVEPKDEAKGDSSDSAQDEPAKAESDSDAADKPAAKKAAPRKTTAKKTAAKSAE